MINVCHVFDRSIGWEQRVAVSQLLERLAPDRFRNHLAAFGATALATLRSLNQPIRVFPCFPGLTLLAAPSLVRFAAKREIDVIHAWGLDAAYAAGVAPNTPVVIELSDPLSAARHVKLLRTIARPRGFAIICGSQTVRRRLVTGGVPAELCVLIRPGVDFAMLNRYRQRSLREELGIDVSDHVAIVPEPATRQGGHLEASLAVKLASDAQYGGVKILIPGESPEQRRIARLGSALPGRYVCVTPGGCYPFERLLASADTLIMTPRGDIATTSIAWAMAAGVAVIGPAVPAVTELITNGRNGLLFKPVSGQAMSGAIAGMLQNRSVLAKAKETARGQAYKIFGLSRYVQQHSRLYENILSGVAPGEGVLDSALAG